ncbi:MULTISPECIES: hypothetical protein [Streptomyces]|uniref:Gliding motility protein n=2 Tax=Streptomyces bottropensis TaxID=42235 RepID=M3DA72_9ACTN|nr:MULTISPECIES: hypothetical protein [Streptomyces]EMF53187.1 hypothetical protein SBD_4731 [Streptomyces bottropensis ATCC 25435]MZD17242.1 hypothetical protein [Streptomyces sp. SID5476]
MGVFSLFRRKAKGADEAVVTASAPSTETEAEKSDEAKGSTEAVQPEPEAATADESVEQEAETVEAADDVEIPKQQTADQAADNEAGEGARK